MRGTSMNRTATVLRGLLALVVLVGLVVGLPLALLAVAGSPIPDSVPDPAQLWDTLTSRDDGTVLLVLLRGAAWFGWALFSVSVLADLVSRARHVRVPSLARSRRSPHTWSLRWPRWRSPHRPRWRRYPCRPVRPAPPRAAAPCRPRPIPRPVPRGRA